MAQPSSDTRAPQPAGVENPILDLQRSLGNRAVTSLLQQSSGQPLDPQTREEMEAKFSHDFSDVRIHDEEAQASSALSAGARALTTGHDIAFSPGFYAPHTSEGKTLLAHELAHVVQQNESHQNEAGGPSASSEAAESEARAAGASVAAGNPASVQASAPAGAQADPMNKQEIEKQIAVIDARVTANVPTDNTDALFTLRTKLLDQWKTAPVAPPAPAPAPKLTPEQEAAQKRKSSDEAELQKAGTTADQVRDYMNLPHGDVMDKYGFFNFWKIRSAAHQLPKGVVRRLLPEEDNTLYLHPSGNVGTMANERANKIANMTVPSGTAGVLMTGGEIYSHITSGKDLSYEDLQNLAQLGNNIEGVAAGAAAIGQGRAANQAVTNSVENQPRQPVVADVRPATATATPPVKPPATPPPAAPPVAAAPAAAPPAAAAPVAQPAAAQPAPMAAAAAAGQVNAPAAAPPPTVFWRQAEQSAVARVGGVDLNTVGKSNFAGIDVVSPNELTTVKAYSGPTAITRNINDLQEISGGRGPMGIGSKVSKTVKDIARLDKQMKASGSPLPLPAGYNADPEAYIQANTVLRVPDDYVTPTQEAIVKDLTDPNNPYGYQSYGLTAVPTPDEAKAFAARRVKGVGKTSEELLK